MKLSNKGAAAIATSEGNVTTAYRCPAKVITIGIGYTNRSASFRGYWKRTRGRELRMGDKMTKQEALKILPDICANEYGAAVNRALKGKTVPQHVYDACVSMVFNCGAGALKWTWFTIGVLNGDYKEAARRLRTTAVTAGGKKLQGLVNRRAHEAAMLEKGHYGKVEKGIPASSSKKPRKPNAQVKEYQAKLNEMGFTCAPDGWLGKGTEKAVKAFQKACGGLLVDGRFGPATYAAVDREYKSHIKDKRTKAPVAKADHWEPSPIDEDPPVTIAETPKPAKSWWNRITGK